MTVVGDRGLDTCRLDVVSSRSTRRCGNREACSRQGNGDRSGQIIPQEYPNFSTRSIDITLPVEIRQLGADLLSRDDEAIVALRGLFLWVVQQFEPMRLEGCSGAGQVRERGVHLITGGWAASAWGWRKAWPDYGARLGLAGRSARRTPIVEQLEALGAEVPR
jgi:hypothetical protein